MLQCDVNYASVSAALPFALMETMGDRIRMLRKSRTLSQEALAEKLRARGVQITGNAISQWERDEVHNPKLKTFLALAAEFQTSMDYLVHGASDPTARDSAGKSRKRNPEGGSGNKA